MSILLKFLEKTHARRRGGQVFCRGALRRQRRAGEGGPERGGRSEERAHLGKREVVQHLAAVDG
ncbi:hypothetical protein, partial [Anaerotruncus massiliensis (ex Liu et al. 2021)]|uniref:hypothetical protein n=1 Tax=Anaerotruncus massiliensis (ex Liu et al. 2021) TaxID=2321404 RepID=UPI003A864508